MAETVARYGAQGRVGADVTAQPPEAGCPLQHGELQLQPSPPLFQQTPRFQALDRKPIHLSLEKLTFGDVFQREPLRRAEA